MPHVLEEEYNKLISESHEDIIKRIDRSIDSGKKLLDLVDQCHEFGFGKIACKIADSSSDMTEMLIQLKLREEYAITGKNKFMA